jgi:nucleolin
LCQQKSDDSEDDESDESASSASSSDDEDGSDSSEDEKEAPSKKRKADDQPVAATKKTKTDSADDNGPKNLFVGNLSWNVDDEWLFREFEEFGDLNAARVITDKESGRSRGFGYVEFNSSTAAAAALKAKKDSMIDGRAANVDFSTPRTEGEAPKDRAQNRAAQFGDSQNPPSDTIFVGNLSFEADENSVGEAFGEHGTVVNVRLPTDM